MFAKAAIRKLLLAAVLSGSAAVPTIAQADSIVGPFWGRPFPFGYAYVRPRDECYALRRVETPYGIKVKRVWVCGEVVTSRY